MLAERGRMLQVVHEFFDPGLTVSRIELLADLSTRFGIPTTLSPLFHTRGRARRHRAGDGRGRAGVGRRRPGVAAGADPADRHLLDDGPAQHHVPRHPGLVERAGDGRPGAKLEALADPAIRPMLVAGMAQAVATRGPGIDPANYIVRDVALDANRDLVGRTLGDIAAERGTTPPSC